MLFMFNFKINKYKNHFKIIDFKILIIIMYYKFQKL